MLLFSRDIGSFRRAWKLGKISWWLLRLNPVFTIKLYFVWTSIKLRWIFYGKPRMLILKCVLGVIECFVELVFDVYETI